MGAIAASNGSSPGRTVQSMLDSARPGRGSSHVETVGEWAIGHRSDDGSSFTGAADGWHVAWSGSIDAIAGSPGRPDGTEVAAAFRRYGAGAADHLRGDYALVASNGHTLVAARDHLGTEPLFTGSRTGGTVVAGQPKQVAAGLGISRRMDIDAVLDLFYGRTDVGAEVPCVVEQVERIRRGSVLVVDDNGVTSRRSWTTPEPGSAQVSVDQAIERFVDLGATAVERTLTDTSGIALSGGIDSTTVAALSALSKHRPLALSAVYPHAPSVDESDYIEMMAARAGLELVTFVPDYQPHTEIDRWVDLCDTPLFGPSIPAIAELLARAHDLGLTSLLVGEMAELAFDLREHMMGDLLLEGHWGVLWRQLRHFRSVGARRVSLMRTLASSIVPGPLGLAYHRRSTPADGNLPSWLDRSYFPGIGHRWDFTQPVGRRWKELQGYFASGASFPGLEMATICGHEMGVSLRRPLVDRDLWEFLITLPAHVKFPDGITKSLVRRAMRGRIPDAILDRKDKTVFTEDVGQRAPYELLRGRLDDAEFRLPGVRYPELLAALDSQSMSQWEVETAGRLASIHAFVRAAP